LSHCGAAADGVTDIVTEVVEEQEGEAETDGVDSGAIDGATDALAEKDGVDEALLDTEAMGVGVIVLEIVALLDAEVVAVPEGEAVADGESVREAVCETLREVEPDTVAVAAVDGVRLLMKEGVAEMEISLALPPLRLALSAGARPAPTMACAGLYCAPVQLAMAAKTAARLALAAAPLEYMPTVRRLMAIVAHVASRDVPTQEKAVVKASLVAGGAAAMAAHVFG
jgi:hypothetical protein